AIVGDDKPVPLRGIEPLYRAEDLEDLEITSIFLRFQLSLWLNRAKMTYRRFWIVPHKQPRLLSLPYAAPRSACERFALSSRRRWLTTHLVRHRSPLRSSPFLVCSTGEFGAARVCPKGRKTA